MSVRTPLVALTRQLLFDHANAQNVNVLPLLWDASIKAYPSLQACSLNAS